MFCNSCSIDTSGKAYCPKCGEPTSSRAQEVDVVPACWSCKKPLKSANSSFCNFCGEPQNKTPVGSDENDDASPETPNAPVEETAVATTGASVSDESSPEASGALKEEVPTAPTTAVTEDEITSAVELTTQEKAVRQEESTDSQALTVKAEEQTSTPTGATTSSSTTEKTSQDTNSSGVQKPQDQTTKQPKVDGGGVDDSGGGGGGEWNPGVKPPEFPYKLIAIVLLGFCLAIGITAYFVTAYNSKPTVLDKPYTPAPAPEPELTKESLPPPAGTEVQQEPLPTIGGTIPGMATTSTEGAVKAPKTEPVGEAKPKAKESTMPKPKPPKPPKVTEAPPAEPAPRIQAAPPQPQEAAVRSCNEAFLLSRPVCFLEGPKTFWKCSPDGKNWNHSIPGCMRQNQSQ